MFMALATQSKRSQAPAIQAVGRLTGFLSSQVTSRNPAFVLGNYASDSLTAMTTANIPFFHRLLPVFAIDQLAALGRLAYNKIADSDYGRTHGMTVSEQYEAFKLEAQRGSRWATRDRGVQKEIRRKLYEPAGAGKAADIAKKLVTGPILAVEFLADLLEDSTRYNVFLHSINRRTDSTYSSRIMQGKDAREGTVDFGKSGSSETLKTIRAAVPFLNPNLQGVYKTTTTFSAENAGNRAKQWGRF